MEYEINVTTDKGQKFVITVDNDAPISPSVGTLCRFHFTLDYPVVEFHGYPVLNDTGLAREVTMDVKITGVVMTSFCNPVSNFAFVPPTPPFKNSSKKQRSTVTNPSYMQVYSDEYNFSIEASLETIIFG